MNFRYILYTIGNPNNYGHHVIVLQIWVSVWYLALWSWVYDCPTQTHALTFVSPLASTKRCYDRETGVWVRDSLLLLHGPVEIVAVATISWQQKHLLRVLLQSSFLYGCRTRLIQLQSTQLRGLILNPIHSLPEHGDISTSSYTPMSWF